MKIYIYNYHNQGEYLNTIEKEVAEDYVIAAPETDIAPPDAESGKVWCFDGTSWNRQIADYRGQICYDVTDSRKSEKVLFVGELKEGFTFTAPPDAVKHYTFENGVWTRQYDPEFYSKLAIRRACRELGLESKLDNLLASNTDFKKDWDDALEIDLYDSLVSEALHTGAFTDAEYDALKEKLNG